MAKKKKEKPIYNGITFDSFEEIEFYQWCEEAEEAGLIKMFKYHSRCFTLTERATYQQVVEMKTKTKVVDKFLLHPHVYSPDFEIWGAKDIGLIDYQQDGWHLIDVKGKGERADQKTIFSMNQKFLLDKHGCYVERVRPRIFFEKTFVPEKARYTPTGRLRKCYIGCLTISEFKERV